MSGPAFKPQYVFPKTPQQEALSQAFAHDRVRIVSYDAAFTSKQLREALQQELMT